MPNKNVEGVWVVTGISLLDDMRSMGYPEQEWHGKEYKSKSRVATTKQGLKQAINAANDHNCIRVEVEHYPVGAVETYNAELE